MSESDFLGNVWKEWICPRTADTRDQGG